jgi:aryl-alcohol dehydrogenase-like predicted oxidoreductase
MHTIHLPNTGLSPSVLCLGGVSLGSTLDAATSYELLDAFVALGGNFIDTARIYADWLPGERSVSEKTIGRWLRQRRNRAQVIVATKGAHPELSTMHKPRLAPKFVVADLEQSLRNLQTDYIDLYWLHRDDPTRPVAEIIDTLHAQVIAGKIRAFGCSNWRAARITAAQHYAHTRGYTGFVANQMLWSLATVDAQNLSDPTMVNMDSALYSLHRQINLAAIPYASQANGYFQRLAAGTLDAMPPASRRLYDTPANRARYARIQMLAADSGLTVTAIVLGYLRGQPFPTIPIIGCHTLAQLEDSCRAADTRLSIEQIAFLEGRRAA